MREAPAPPATTGGTRREFLRAMGLGAAALTVPAQALAALRSAGASAGRPPNVVFILVDDLGWTDLGCYGSTFYETPNIDALAGQGIRFTDAYAASPVCSPTRAAIMTGKHPARLGITDWIPGQKPPGRKLLGPEIREHVPTEEVTIAEALRQAGYKTFLAGKWHLGFFPEQHGFDINKGGCYLGSPFNGYLAPYKIPTLEDGPDGEYLTDRLTDETLRFINDNRDSPFFAYLSFYTVHAPIEACRRHLERFRRKAAGMPKEEGPALVRERDAWTRQRQERPNYASMVYAMDENVGRVLKRLDELGLSDNTIVIFVSDNGGWSTMPRPENPAPKGPMPVDARRRWTWKGAPTSVLPLRAGKGWCYEGGLRVPLIIRAPGLSQPGSVSHVPVTSADFYPTILELAGLPSQPQQHCDGLSMLPLLKGAESLARDALYWHHPHYNGADWTPGAALRVGDWKLIEFYEEQRVELYNLADDIGERHDLAAQMPDKRDELLDRLHTWQKRVAAPMPRPNPDCTKPEE